MHLVVVVRRLRVRQLDNVTAAVRHACLVLPLAARAGAQGLPAGAGVQHIPASLLQEVLYLRSAAIE